MFLRPRKPTKIAAWTSNYPPDVITVCRDSRFGVPARADSSTNFITGRLTGSCPIALPLKLWDVATVTDSAMATVIQFLIEFPRTFCIERRGLCNST